MFTLEDAEALLGRSSQVTSNLLSRLLKQGWIGRVRRGVYEVAPLWAEGGTYAGDRFSTLGHSLVPPYYIGYRSALELYGWIQHPVIGRLWVAVPSKRRTLRTPRDEIVWVVTTPDRFAWGVRDHWIGPSHVIVSDQERTILDCLHLPRHAGGITEVAGSLLRAWPVLDQKRLDAHVKRLALSSVARRLGALIETLEPPNAGGFLRGLAQGPWRGRPVSLDPNLPATGDVNPRWGVLMNVPADELAAIGRT